MNDGGPIFIPCECGHEGIVVERDQDQAYLSIYSHGLSVSSPWSFRLRTIWRVLRYGTPYGDCVILGEAGRKALADAMIRAREVSDG